MVLTKKHNRPFLSPATVNSSVAVEAKSYVYFSAFDDIDKPKHLMYRVCQVQGEAYGVVYQECSTENVASGAGVYMQVYDLKINDWDRVVSIHWCDSLAGRKRNSERSEPSVAWGRKRPVFLPQATLDFSPRSTWKPVRKLLVWMQIIFFSVSKVILPCFSLFCLKLVGIQNTKYSKQLTGKQLSVTLWLTEDILRILCSWTSKSRYSLCSNRW